MISSRQSIVQQLFARIRELLAQPKGQNRSRTFQLREYAAWPTDMPWYPRVAQLTPEDLELLHWLRQELDDELGHAETINDSDVLYFALLELQLALMSRHREDEVLRLRFHLWETEQKRGGH